MTQAKNSLRAYQSAISANWQAEEAAFINRAIDAAISDINAAINQINPLSSNIRRVADQIRREEEAAERAQLHNESSR
jgi:hypothetical protein